MFAGLSRKAATEFSFFLAMPTMLGAATFDLIKNADVLTSDNMVNIGVGFVAAFIAALLVVKALYSSLSVIHYVYLRGIELY